MNQEFVPNSQRRLLLIALLSWLSMLGFDFVLHAGLLAKLYLHESPFLLPPTESFKRIPLGYLSFLLLTVLLLWLLTRLKLVGWRAGFGFGLKLGAFIWGAFVLGLFSISTADVGLLLAWFFGQTSELAIAGAVTGAGLAGERLPRLFAKVLAFILILVIVTVVLQSLGLAPAARP